MVGDKEPFELIEHLGTGGFAQTWRARVIDLELSEEWDAEEVAVKIPLTRKKELLLKKELQLTGSLHIQLTDIESKNIVKYLGFEVFEDKIVMVMEYIKGGNLRNFIGNIGHWKALGLKEACQVAQGILEGISVIHKKHIFHRDIKPENILMDGKIPKISDFGVGRMLKTNELASTTSGTLYYMAPELLFEERGASFNADLWSFGITFYEMLYGQFPFGISEKMPPGKVISLITDTNVKLVFPPKTAVPAQLQNIISRILDRNHNLRYKTADEVMRDLRNFYRGEDEVVEQEIGLIQQLLQDPLQASVAENKLREILRKFPESAYAYLHLGEFYNKCGSFDKAIAMFKKGIEKKPNSALFYWDMAIAYQEKKEFKPAIAALERALELGLEKSLERYAKALLKTLQKKV